MLDLAVPEKITSLPRVRQFICGDKNDVAIRQKWEIILWWFNEVIHSGLLDGVNCGNATNFRCSEWEILKSRV